MAEGGYGRNQEAKGGPYGGGGKDDISKKKDPRDPDDHKGKKKNYKFDRMGRIDREQEHSHDESQEDMERDPEMSHF